MSGYSENFRYEVISSAMACYEKYLARAAERTGPLYHPKGYKEEERRKKKQIKKKEVGTNPSQLSCFALLPPAASWQNSPGRWLKRKQITMDGL